MSDKHVQGFCPMGCGDTLFLGSGGFITCGFLECPRPDAVSDILLDRETEHVVVLDGDGFTVRHPLRERLDGKLEDCQLHIWLKIQSGPPFQLGQYRVLVDDEGEPVHWTALAVSA